MNLPHVVTLQSLNNLSQVISSPPPSSSSSTTVSVMGTWIILSTVLLLNNNSHPVEEVSEGRGETEWIITVGQNYHQHHHHHSPGLGGGGGGGQGKDEWWEVRMNHSKVLKLIQDTKAKLPIQSMIDRIVTAFNIPTALVLSFPPASPSSSSSTSFSNIGLSIMATPSVTLNLVLIPRPIDQLAVSLITLLATSIPSLKYVTSARLSAATATQLLETIEKERDRALAKLSLLESTTTTNSSFSSSQRHNNNNNGSPSAVHKGRKTWKSMKEKEREEEEEEDEELRLKFEKEEEWNTGEEGSGAIKSEYVSGSGTMKVGGNKRVKREENGLAQGLFSRRIAKHRPEINNGHGGKSGGGVAGARGKIVERPSLDDDPFG